MNKRIYTPTAKSYFSGAGGMDLGMSMEGIDVIQSLEMDKASCNTLKANFNHDVLQVDICDKLVLEQPHTDIMIGTYPCTKYSTIANIHGTRTGDDLFLHYFRHVVLERPEVFVVENVPGMLKFPVVMEALEKLPGYYVKVYCPVDSNNWSPQNRKRLIVFGSKEPMRIADPVGHKRVKLRDIIEKDAEFKLTKGLFTRMKGGYRDMPIISDPANDDATAPTCVAHYAKDKSTRVVVDKRSKLGVRPYTLLEWSRLQGFPDTFKWPVTSTDQYKQVGNAVHVDVARWVGKQVFNYFN